MQNKGVKVAIQAGLLAAIVFLGYWLYRSINDPWEAIENERAVTEMTRDRMTDVRTALVYYEQSQDAFPGTLDSLMMWLAEDSLMMIAADSLFDTEGFVLDSLLYSPRTGSMFEYSLNDTGRVAIYLLRDPDSDDHIGSAAPDVTQLNASSWE